MPAFTVSRASGTPTDDATTYMGHPVALDTREFEQPERLGSSPEVPSNEAEPGTRPTRAKPVGRYARRGGKRA